MNRFQNVLQASTVSQTKPTQLLLPVRCCMFGSSYKSGHISLDRVCWSIVSVGSKRFWLCFTLWCILPCEVFFHLSRSLSFGSFGSEQCLFLPFLADSSDVEARTCWGLVFRWDCCVFCSSWANIAGLLSNSCLLVWNWKSHRIHFQRGVPSGVGHF